MKPTIATSNPVDDIPGFEVFREEMKRIYPEGDLYKAYGRLKWYIENERFCADGTALTYRLIMEKFAGHIRQWNVKYGSRDPKYVGRAEEEKRKDLYEFLGARYFDREFISFASGTERNEYLFGGFTADYLNQQLAVFKQTLPDGHQSDQGQQ